MPKSSFYQKLRYFWLTSNCVKENGLFVPSKIDGPGSICRNGIKKPWTERQVWLSDLKSVRL